MSQVKVGHYGGSVSAFVMVSESQVDSADLTLFLGGRDDAAGAYQLDSLPPIDFSSPIYDDPIYLFNRIITPLAYRRQGIGTKLLKAVTDHALERRFHIFCVTNSYGGEGDPTNSQLTDWYSSRGFDKLEPTGKSLFFNFRKEAKA